MPYKVKKNGEKFDVVKGRGGKVLGTHDNEADANKQLAALYSQEKEYAAGVLESAPFERYMSIVEGSVQSKRFKEGFQGILLGPIEEADGKPGRRWAVAILREGLSANRRFYPADVVSKAAALFEGKPAYWNHDLSGNTTMRDPRDLTGYYRNVRPVVMEGLTTAVGELDLVSGKARKLLRECAKTGGQTLPGISIVAEGTGERVQGPNGSFDRVNDITKAISADIVMEPAAGGRFLKLVAGGAASEDTEKELEMFDQKLVQLRESFPKLARHLSATPTESEIDALLRLGEAKRQKKELKESKRQKKELKRLLKEAKGDGGVGPGVDPDAEGTDEKNTGKPFQKKKGQLKSKAKASDAGGPMVDEDNPMVSEAMRKVLGLTDENDIKAFRASVLEAKVDRYLDGRTLLQEAQDNVRSNVRRFLELGAAEESIKEYVEREVKTQARIAEQQLGIVGAGVGRVIESGTDQVDKIMRAWEGFFLGEDAKSADGKTKHARFTSLREGYIATTGDAGVTGRMNEGMLRRFAGVTVFEGKHNEHKMTVQEAVSTGGFSNVLASTLNRQLVRDYKAETSLYGDVGRGWLYTVVPANDFRNRVRVRFGGYANLPTVSEQGTYQPLTSPTDEGATYAVAKRGGLETLTFESIKNDDVGFVQRIPQRLAVAAARTHYEYIHNLYVGNGTGAIYDGNNLFDANNHQGNLGSTALSKAGFGAARQTILKMQELNSGKRIGLVLRHLMVPIELQETAVNLFLMIVQPGMQAANFEPDFIAKVAKAQVHVIAHATDPRSWYSCVGADQCEQIEMGYLDGREDPEIFVADLPNAGNLFFADKVDYKIRHIYNGAIIDYRGMFGSIVS